MQRMERLPEEDGSSRLRPAELGWPLEGSATLPGDSPAPGAHASTRSRVVRAHIGWGAEGPCRPSMKEEENEEEGQPWHEQH